VEYFFSFVFYYHFKWLIYVVEKKASSLFVYSFFFTRQRWKRYIDLVLCLSVHCELLYTSRK